ncbi:UDP-N-acetylmuramoyl-tripeptide--D-alanyl-D-alanine ligase [Dermatophilus congolensis]|uniref:UDP-N-acetylmuramoyl-tripeptide--D-alanyl-D-alanine ligase n=1 Tax=Dermatophilus congolensis TaxID=1863 RepID=A0A239VHM8_9MICO|nr:UDP-N-acetylmuramoyl-tripeptide--D-alanyl-D-alanine ligase [Dermatophilus congolensis]MBO3140109.1 UDP-N-acetylmuramoyl-tripeptide--D-alanyl-D-alanine ligase [Dermatophilus congolensis]MBO3145852.1 UDP-N-acetylmuramoyl-tripeptide--D-alanyl-D-alanine ligase [Dermatophilus congolensis]MBO3146848.1 UDP-N-acetylmuramoyl-tripeptide--D-alanyl-D-alanine ligase [Dermatophilus congolensis]MBO3149094.1 UDP-N-acetylmuramoyl-tripeptide--D-alanyl-D-alanine ligase [Dermatophilus congolensis]MBO3154847.1 
MIPLTLGKIACITSGRLSSPEAADILVKGSVVTDSRAAEEGSLYIARIGEHADGHAYAASAADNGAVAALVTTPIEDLPYVQVDDVQDAFAALASFLIETQEAAGELTVIGVTGSSGKTTTKDLIAHVLNFQANTVANVGSLNSEVGVPLTVCRITPQTRYLVLEMGARGIGHVNYLTTMTHPSVGVVLNVGSAHIGEFGSREAIARAKSELPMSLPKGGLAVLNADDELVSTMSVADEASTVRFGTSEGSDIRASHIVVGEDGCPSFTLTIDEESIHVDLGLMGDHQVWNALAAAAVATWAGMNLSELKTALETARPASRYRMERHDRPDGTTVINDAYNANPESMSSAIRTLSVMAGQGETRRRTYAVLGAMFELGDEEEAEHRAVGQLAARLGIDEIVAVGESPGVEAYVDGANSEILPGSPNLHVQHVATVEAALEKLESMLHDGDLVLVKSSHGAGLWRLGEDLVRGGGNA